MSDRTQEERNRLRKRLATLAIAVVALPIAFYLPGIIRGRQAATPEKLPQSEPVFSAPPVVAQPAPPKEGDVSVDRQTIIADTIIATKERINAQFTIVAQETPALITSVVMPFAQSYGVVLDASQCLAAKLEPGRGCVVNLTYDPASPNRVDGRILIEAISMRSDGSSRQISRTVSVQLTSTVPPPPPVMPAAIQNSVNQDDQNDYLRRRGRVGLLGQQQADAALTHLGPQRPRDDSWSKIGFKPNMSTYPVDLSRIVTMDKPIPAVLKLPIDARSAGRAVATVERDIYGGDGRLVVIERGSTLIGTVASSSATSEEKLGISWQRIVRPDGAAFAITATSGDAMGRAGVPAHLDNRWFDRFGRTILFSVLQGGITASVGGQTTTSQGLSGTQQTQDSKALGVSIANQTLTPLLQEYMREQLSLPPIRTIPVGTRLTVFPTTDIMLKPITPNEEMQQEYAARQRQTPEYAAAQQQVQAARQTLREGATPAAPAATLAPQAAIQTVAPPNLFQAAPAATAVPVVTPADAAASFASAPTAAQTLQTRTQNVGRDQPASQLSPLNPVVGQSPFQQYYGTQRQ